MKVDDPDSWSYDAYSGATVWNYGKEIPCNLEGQYVHLVAYLSHLIGSYEMGVCSFGIIGTKYVRAASLIPTSVEVTQGDTLSVFIPHIYSDFAIGTEMAIDLRQADGTELSFVTLINQSGTTEVFIDAIGVVTGDDYELVLQSFNALTTVQSSLKTDIIEVTVQSYVRAEPPPTSVEVMEGETTTILIPHIYCEIAIIDTVQAINLRHKYGTQLPFVTLINQNVYTEVYIDATNVNIGDYELVLQSFNTLSEE